MSAILPGLGIDLERMQEADRAYDLGAMAAELRHHFAWRNGRAHDAGPFIGHFLRTLGLEHFFDATAFSSDYGFRKPDPRLFHIALAILNTPPSEVAYIGNKYETDCILPTPVRQPGGEPPTAPRTRSDSIWQNGGRHDGDIDGI